MRAASSSVSPNCRAENSRRPRSQGLPRRRRRGGTGTGPRSGQAELDAAQNSVRLKRLPRLRPGRRPRRAVRIRPAGAASSAPAAAAALGTPASHRETASYCWPALRKMLAQAEMRHPPGRLDGASCGQAHDAARDQAVSPELTMAVRRLGSSDARLNRASSILVGSATVVSGVSSSRHSTMIRPPRGTPVEPSPVAGREARWQRRHLGRRVRPQFARCDIPVDPGDLGCARLELAVLGYLHAPCSPPGQADDELDPPEAEAGPRCGSAIPRRQRGSGGPFRE